jgi:hypothetical protein
MVRTLSLGPRMVYSHVTVRAHEFGDKNGGGGAL